MDLLKVFRLMVSDSIKIGLETDSSSLKRLSTFAYGRLKRYSCPSAYRLNAISRAAGILASRRKSLRRGNSTRRPYLARLILVSCYGFKIRDGNLIIPLGEQKFERIPLAPHTVLVLSDPLVNVRSFTLTQTSLSLCISKELVLVECTGAVGVDRNLRNLTVGDPDGAIQYDLSGAVRIADRMRRSYARSEEMTRGSEENLHQSTATEDIIALTLRRGALADAMEAFRYARRRG